MHKSKMKLNSNGPNPLLSSLLVSISFPLQSSCYLCDWPSILEHLWLINPIVLVFKDNILHFLHLMLSIPLAISFLFPFAFFCASLYISLLLFLLFGPPFHPSLSLSSFCISPFLDIMAACSINSHPTKWSSERFYTVLSVPLNHPHLYQNSSYYWNPISSYHPIPLLLSFSSYLIIYLPCSLLDYDSTPCNLLFVCQVSNLTLSLLYLPLVISLPLVLLC